MATTPTQSAASTFPMLPRVAQVPVNIIQQQIMSTTSSAAECFIYQRLSSRLQAYLIDYVNKSYSDFPIYH